MNDYKYHYHFATYVSIIFSFINSVIISYRNTFRVIFVEKIGIRVLRVITASLIWLNITVELETKLKYFFYFFFKKERSNRFSFLNFTLSLCAI